MNLNELDKQFEACLDRLKRKQPPVPGAYNLGPLAEDHDTLKKSWDYFKERVQTIESHWQEILNAKNAEVDVLKKRVAELDADVAQLETEKNAWGELDEAVKKVRMDDFIEFNKRCEHLRMVWHAEKETLDREIGRLELKLEEQSIVHNAQRESDQKHIADLKAVAELLRRENADVGQKEEDRVRHFEKQMTEKEEINGMLSRKIELLQAEIERRDQQLKTGLQDNMALNKLVADLKAEIKKQSDQISDQTKTIENLNLRMRIVSEERDTMRTSWQREQAEWRELWERNRELFDKKK